MKRLLSLALILPTAALAHSGHDHGSVGGGFAHPLGGADHVLAMVALGLLAAAQAGQIILTQEATLLVCERLPPEWQLLDRGLLEPGARDGFSRAALAAGAELRDWDGQAALLVEGLRRLGFGQDMA